MVKKTDNVSDDVSENTNPGCMDARLKIQSGEFEWEYEAMPLQISEYEGHPVTMENDYAKLVENYDQIQADKEKLTAQVSAMEAENESLRRKSEVDVEAALEMAR